MNSFLRDKMRIFRLQILLERVCFSRGTISHQQSLNFGQLLNLLKRNVSYFALIFHMHFSVFPLKIKNNL